MFTVYVEETGRLLRVSAGPDLSNYTELSLIFTKPDNTVVTKTTANGVALGTTTITDPDIGQMLANTYVEYSIEAGLVTLADAGTWCVQLLYTDTVPAVPDNIYSDPAQFVVRERCDT